MHARVADHYPRTTFHTVSEGEFSEVHGCGPLLWAVSQRKNSTGAIQSRLTNARAKHTKKKIDSKVRYDSWLLKGTKSRPDETESPPRITAATFRIGPGSKKYQKAT